MWIYEKRLIYPLSIKKPNARIAKLLCMLYGGANGELTAGITYLNQRYSMPDNVCRSILTDIGTEELAHWELLGAMTHISLKGLTQEQICANGLESYVSQFGYNPFPIDSVGSQWTSAYVGCTGDPVADLMNDMAAEQKARAGYEAVLKVCDDPDYAAPLQFLREREIVHFQRFGEALGRVQEKMKK